MYIRNYMYFCILYICILYVYMYMYVYLYMYVDPDWIPTGSRLAKSAAQKCKNWCPIGSRLGPDWIPTRFLQKNTYFLKFEHLFLKF